MTRDTSFNLKNALTVARSLITSNNILLLTVGDGRDKFDLVWLVGWFKIEEFDWFII